MRLVARSAALLAFAIPLAAQQPAPPDLSVDAIFARDQFNGAPMPDIHWLPDGNAWISVRANPAGGSDVVRVDAATGTVTVLADASQFVDSAGRRFTVEGITLSTDAAKALVFHNTVRVWRTNTKGVYHVIDFATKKLTPLSAQPGLQMFAKFSPNGTQAAFVRDNNIFNVDLTTGREHALTQDGSDVVINGTSDWVYEEELGLRDAFRWSPDSRRIAYWRFDQSLEPLHPIMDQSAVHARAMFMRYPQPGDANAHVRVGVVDLVTAHTLWMNVDPDSAYIPTMEWADADSLAIQRLTRAQNRLELLLANANTGGARRVLIEADKAWLDIDHGAPYWLAGGKMFLWPSQRSGWRRYYLYMRDGTPVRAITPDSSDAESIAGIVAKTQTIYVTEAVPNPMERQLFSYMLTRKPERVRVTTETGSHSLNISPNGRIFADTWSAAGVPPQAVMRDAGTLAVKRVLESNQAFRDQLARASRAPEFFKIPMPDGTILNAWRMVRADFDSTKPHPVVMYVYGGPNSQTVTNSYGGRRELWHLMLAQKGYVVISVDNRGTGARGSAFEKVVYQRLGQLESLDQIEAAKWIAHRRWADSARIAMWGWSGGGFLTALTTSRGGKVFKSGIVVAPVIDFRLYDDIWTERYMRTPAENPDGYKNSSVLTYASGLTARLLLVHGTADDNVHPQNTFWFANALQANRTPFEMMLYPGRTHSITGGNTQAHLFQMMTDFLDRTLAPDKPAGAK